MIHAGATRTHWIEGCTSYLWGALWPNLHDFSVKSAVFYHYLEIYGVPVHPVHPPLRRPCQHSHNNLTNHLIFYVRSCLCIRYLITYSLLQASILKSQIFLAYLRAHPISLELGTFVNDNIALDCRSRSSLQTICLVLDVYVLALSLYKNLNEASAIK